MEYGLIGEHLPHSFSREIHRRCADYDYVLTELAPDQIKDFMTTAAFKAINVTIPYKQTVIPFLAQVDSAAAALGAVNTVVNRQGKLYGYNTDFYGMEALIARIGLSLEGKKVLILGTGGTCRTAKGVAEAHKAREIVTVGRNRATAEVTYEEVYNSHTDADVIINTTPCGMYPYADGTPDRPGTPVDISRFPRLSGVVDAVYNPLRTNLVLQAKEWSIPAEGGLYMLVAQAVKASRIFLEKDQSGMEAQTEAIFKEIVAQKENIVLTGMPGSGKSTLGKELAKALNRPFFDSDEEIVALAGKPISAIFAEEGEGAFRDLETLVLRRLSNENTGAVIATGGGAILRGENIHALKRTGKIYFLDRDLQCLLPTPDRPLALTAEAIKARYAERYDRYCTTADVTVKTDEILEHTLETVRKDFEL